MKILTLSRQDAYALSRALVGCPWVDQPVSSLVYAMLTRLDLKKPDEMAFLRQILGTDLMRQVLAADPQSEPPSDTEADTIIAPSLPQDARPTPEQADAAATVGGWLKDCVQ